MKSLGAVAKRWVLVIACVALGVAGAMVYSLVSPQYSTATVRTYTTSGTSDLLEAYQGSQAARASVQSFAVLATDPVVVQRAIAKSGVAASLDDVLVKTSASVQPGTVIVDISVQDESAEDAQKLALAVAQELVGLVDKLGQPADGGAAALKLVVVDPSTQGAVRDQLFDPVDLAVGGGIGLVIGVLLSLLLDSRSSRRKVVVPEEDLL